MKFFDFGKYCPGVFDFIYYVQLMTLNRVACIRQRKELIMKNIEINFKTIEIIAAFANEEAFIQRKYGNFGFIFFNLQDKDGFVQFYIKDGELKVFPHNFGGNFEENWNEGKRIDLVTILCFLKKKQLVEAPIKPLW